MPQSQLIAQQAARGESWMLPEAKSEDLLYVSDDGDDDVVVYSYPKGKLVGRLTHGISNPQGVCADKNGNVFVTNNSPTELIEYAHGEKTPIATLPDGNNGFHIVSCSVDSTSGNLAATNSYGVSYPYEGTIAVYVGAQGEPRYYSKQSISGFGYCAYDNRGRLLYSAENDNYRTIFGELTHDGILKSIKVKQSFGEAPIGWYRGLLEVGNRNTTIFQFNVRRRQTVPKGSIGIAGASGYYQFTIFRGVIIVADFSGGKILFWPYPAGGSPTKTITQRLRNPFGVVVSVAPGHKQRR